MAPLNSRKLLASGTQRLPRSRPGGAAAAVFGSRSRTNGEKPWGEIPSGLTCVASIRSVSFGYAGLGGDTLLCLLWTTLAYAENVGSQFLSLRQPPLVLPLSSLAEQQEPHAFGTSCDWALHPFEPG